MYKLMLKFETLIHYTLLAGLVLISFINVISRYFFNAPIQWAEEVLLALFVWLVFSSISVCYRNGGLISVDLIDNLLSEANKRRLFFFLNIFLLIMICIVLYWSLALSMQAHIKVTNILRVPYSFIDFSLVFGSALLIRDIIWELLKTKLKK